MAPMTQGDDDPIIATYSVYLTPPPPKEKPPRSLLIQYPERDSEKPYGPETHQTPVQCRLKPSTGLVELDVPIDTILHYNQSRGSAYATALQNSRILQVGGSHGLAGGFNTGPGGRNYRAEDDDNVDLNRIPRHDDTDLKIQTLGGKIAKPADGDAIYMLGTFQGSELHLTHLDALVQVRPQLHHLDATDEVARGAAARPARKGGAEEKSETRAMEIKVKSAEEKNADRSRKRTNAEMLTAIQSERWETYTWLDSSDAAASNKFHEHMVHSHDPSGAVDDEEYLTSALTPTSYLDSISAPRIDLALSLSANPNAASKSALGLMGKVRGRERERRRRKKNDADRKAAAQEAARRTAEAIEKGHISPADAAEHERALTEELHDEGSSDSGSSDDSGSGDDDHNVAVMDGDETVPSSARNPPTMAPPDEAQTVKKPRGRPRKSSTQVKLEPMNID